MKSAIKYKTFYRDRSLDELNFEISLWNEDLNFVAFEIPFLEQLIKTYPFNNMIPNLFEQIQLFLKELNHFKEEKVNLDDEIFKLKKELSGMIECNDLNCDNYYIIRHEELAKKMFNYIQHYRNTKLKLFEYLKGILN